MIFKNNVIRNFFQREFHKENPWSINALTKKNMPWFIGWIAVFIWLYSYFLPMGGFRFQSNLYNGITGSSMIYYYTWLISAGIIPLVFQARQFVPKTVYSVLITLTCFGVITFIGSGIVSIGAMILASACIGHIFVSFGYGFFMMLNNAEKIYSMVLAVLLPKLLMLGKPLISRENNRVDTAVIIILIVMLILLGCSCFLRSFSQSLTVGRKEKVPRKAYSLMPLVFVLLTLNDVIAPSLLQQMETQLLKRQVESFYFVGIFLGILTVILLQKQLMIKICYMLNLSLALLAAGFTLKLASFENYDIGILSAVFFGSSYAIGLINIYYLSGFMTKKFQSIMFYRIGILLSVLCYFTGFLFQNLFKDCSLISSSAIIALISVSIVLLLFILSPFFINTLYFGEWIDDTYRSDVTQCSRLEARLIELRLTPAEIEVCKLLLDGNTLRQIAGLQSKAYATINTYCTSIYRKLNVNSRAELLLSLQDYKD